MKTPTENETLDHPFLRDLSPEHLDILLEKSAHTEFAPGEVILKQGEPANQFFLIERGKVAIESNNHAGEVIQYLGPGEPLGWSWLFQPFCWHFTARAIEPTQCTVLNGGHLLVTAEENPDFGYKLMRRVAQVVISRLQATRKKLLAAQKRK